MENQKPPAPLQPCITQLKTAARRIQSALDEATPSVEQLGSAFTSIISNSRQLNRLTDAESNSETREDMQDFCDAIEKEAGQAIMGFQFYDRLSQRLGHVHESLQAISELLEDTDPHPNLEDWENLVVRIVDTLCLDDDRHQVASLLDHKIDTRNSAGKQDDSEIELF